MAERYTVAVGLIMVGVAQSAERIPVEDEVAGSFPVAHPKKPPKREAFFFKKSVTDFTNFHRFF